MCANLFYSTSHGFSRVSIIVYFLSYLPLYLWYHTQIVLLFFFFFTYIVVIMPTNGEYNNVEEEKKSGEMLSAQSQHDSSRTNIFLFTSF